MSGAGSGKLGDLRAWLGASQAGVWRWKAAGDLVSIDQDVRRQFGISATELIHDLSQLLAAANTTDSQYLHERLHQCSQLSPFHCTTVRIQDQETGAIRWLANYISRFHEEEDAWQAIVLSIDVTSQRSVEELSLEARRLESLGRLAGGVAHESNNQMMVVLQCVDFILADRNIPEVIRGDIELVRKAAERTANITAQLLAFGRRQVLRPRLVDLNASLKESMLILERTLEGRGQLHLHLDSRVKYVHMDPDQLNQILLNLVLNAREALADHGHVLITSQIVKFEPGAAILGAWEPVIPGEYAMVVVADNGSGMDEVTRARVFEPFFTTKEVGRGTGLGLAMIYGILRQSNGYIWVESKPGDGSTFRMLLPLAGQNRSGPVDPVPTQLARPLNPTTIMVVDDDPDVRTVMVRTLKEGGYDVLEAESGIAALRQLAVLKPVDLLLTDLVMPGMSGEELGSLVAQRALASRILYMSGLPPVAREAPNGFNDGEKVLQKPMSPADLLEEVHAILATSTQLT